MKIQLTLEELRRCSKESLDFKSFFEECLEMAKKCDFKGLPDNEIIINLNGSLGEIKHE